MKICSKCGVEKDESEFYKKKDCKDGLVPYCKKCHSEKTKKYYFENKNKILAVCKLYRIENYEKVKKAKINSMNKKPLEYREKRKEYYKKNKQYIDAKNKKYSDFNPDFLITHYCKQYLKKQIGEDPPPELVELKKIIIKTKRLCKTSKN